MSLKQRCLLWSVEIRNIFLTNNFNLYDWWGERLTIIQTGTERAKILSLGDGKTKNWQVGQDQQLSRKEVANFHCRNVYFGKFQNIGLKLIFVIFTA